MKCIYCNQDHNCEEVRSINYIFCCSKIQIDYTSLRQKVRDSIRAEEYFLQKLNEVIAHSGK